jgi:hypothetical protein
VCLDLSDTKNNICRPQSTSPASSSSSSSYDYSSDHSTQIKVTKSSLSLLQQQSNENTEESIPKKTSEADVDDHNDDDGNATLPSDTETARDDVNKSSDQTELVLLCKLCNKLFDNMHRLQRHMLSHDMNPDLRKFKCDFCNKAFKFKHHLKVSFFNKKK